MPSPKVSYSDLDEAFLFASDEWRCWLDKQTGRILAYSEEAEMAIEEGELDDAPEWMKDDIDAAREVLRAFGELPGQEEDPAGNSYIDLNRYVSIEQIPSHEAFQVMADFIDEVNNERACDAMSRALAGHKPFRRFKDALNDFPKERERWFEYEAKRRRDYIEEWAHEQGVELDFGESAS